MADWHGIISKSSINGYSRRSIRDEDFEEEDVWSVVKESEDSSPKMRKSKNYYPSSSSGSWRLHSSPRRIPATAAATHEGRVAQQSSAPVNIPDWSKIYGKSTGMGSWVDHDGCVFDDANVNNEINEEEEEDDDDEMVPPHEWIAKKLARSQISSFSVCEGIGRTLKGRDLSKLRNAILTKTGFLE